jgi:head-tail joining protein
MDSKALDYMAGREAGQFDKSCTIQQAVVSNGAQGPAVTWANRASGVGCSLSDRPGGAREKGEAGTVRGISEWVVKLPQGQTVAVTDRILIGARTFQVEQVVDASYATVVMCLCSEMR